MNDFSIIELAKREKWDDIVKSFRDYDVYYLSGYVSAFAIHGDGEPILIYYQADPGRAIGVFMKRDVNGIASFHDNISSGEYYDLITPYGYGGFIFEGSIDISIGGEFNTKYMTFLKQNHIIAEFVRYHPLLGNASYMKQMSDVVDLGQTIDIRLDSLETLWANITSKNRNAIRRAQKHGVEIFYSTEWSLFEKFIPMYNSTMDKDKALKYYYFSEAFYRSLHQELINNYLMFYAMYQGEIISMAIILFANRSMHYHLSCSLLDYRVLNAGNLLLYEVAVWGCEHGYKTFHLGGGVGSGEDNLFKFKQSFNRHSGNRFSIGKRIVQDDVYNRLVHLREQADIHFNLDSQFFPLYRV